MHAVRTRAACVARRTRPTAARTTTISRSYASESHDNHGHDGHHHHHHAPEVEEKLSTAFYVFASALPLSYLGYSITRPGANGEPSSVTKWLKNFDYFNDQEVRNALRTNLFEQAAHDRHLLHYAGKNPHIELKTPELINSGAPWNVPASHYRNLDHVTEHYRKQAADDEERKLQKLLEKSRQQEQQQQEQS
ncbi:uncharacterized protein F4822DRAFT_401128 [Hypoxylon trugodes]|uniref:uncharacterized protein n=1 Tax=Hypoxylon trugodes TaxID=326681 RepID=UPI0021901FA1|nr:uncharacterized protein F4822DRAFT_401128 [Hypoxylon trugodes]KAI1390185.1 hypothetical protein F4822DRAFT_401128 [Hypoxylon trugodes]